MTKQKGTVVAIVSGGMDSVVMAYWLKQRGFGLRMLSFNYGQRHRHELGFAVLAAHALGAEHTVIDLPITHLLKGSALTDDIAVPHGHYAAETMKVTVVPNRNAMMLSVATAVAVAEGAHYVATAVHAGDHAIYPDCRPEFIEAMSKAMRLANEGFLFKHFTVTAPFVHMTKADIVCLGYALHVPFADTWSCYEGDGFHCGRCGTCVERREAFALAGIADPTTYREVQ